MARSRRSSAYSPRPTQRRRHLEQSEMDSENDSEGVSRTNSQLDGNTSTQSTSVTISSVSYLPSTSTVNESSPQASSHADNSMVLRELQALKQAIQKMSTDHDRRFLQLERSTEKRFLQLERSIEKMSTNLDRQFLQLERLINIMSRFAQQQSESSKGGDRAESSGGVDVRINAGGDIDAQNEMFAPTDIGFETERGVERDMEDSPLNEIFYQTPTCSSDKDYE